MTKDSVSLLAENFNQQLCILRECTLLDNLPTDERYYIERAKKFQDESTVIFQRISERLKTLENIQKQSDILDKDVHALSVQLDAVLGKLPELLKSHQISRQDVVDCAKPKQNVNKGKNVVATDSKQLPPSSFKFPAPLTEAEFNAIPKYMRGRLTLGIVNKALEELQAAIEVKYNLMRTPRNQLNPTSLALVNKYRTQENEHTRGYVFVTDEDLRVHGTHYLKMDKQSYGILVVLRHCGKVKEIRGPKGLLRVAVEK